MDSPEEQNGRGYAGEQAAIIRSRLRRAAERLYEDPRLRDNLTDAQAEQILAWGLAEIQREAERTASLAEEEAIPLVEEHTQAVKRVIRLVNRLVKELPTVARPKSREFMVQFVDNLCEVDNRTVHINDMLTLDKMALNREELDGEAIFQGLMQIIEANNEEE